MNGTAMRTARRLGGAILLLLLGPVALAQKVEVRKPDGFGVSPPMRDFPKDTKPAGPPREMYEPGPLPWLGGPPTGQPDPLLPGPQAAPSPLLAATIGANFDGVGLPNYAVAYAPPDTNGDVSPNWYVQWVNVDWAVFSKAGVLQPGFPKAGNSFWASWATASCPSCTTAQKACGDRNDGDPIVKYDRAADRWVMTQFAVPNNRGPDYQCVAVSTTNDPAGAYYLYAYTLTYFNDYPKLGVWPDAYYITYNMFTNSFQGAAICAYDRASMLSGVAGAAQQCTQLTSAYGGLLPADWNGAAAPATGAPEYLFNFTSSPNVNVWRSAVTWGGTPTMTVTGPTAIGGIAAFTRTCNGGACVAQPGTTNQLDSLADRLMYRIAYRNFGTYETFLLSHSVDPTGSGSTASGVRWYEVRNTPPAGAGGAVPVLFQQGTFAPSSTQFRWMPSIAMDKTGDIAIGYSLSDGTSVKPSVYFTGRVPGDAAGTMRSESAIQAGAGSQTGSLNRWGDYSAMQIDPADDCTFWYTTEYLKANGSFNWSTRVASFTITPDAPAAPTLTPGANQIGLSWTAVPGAVSYTILRSDGACPGGTFAPIATGVTGTSYVDTTAAGGSTYSYQVKTVACATSAASACASATALPGGCTAPAAPTLSSATGTCAGVDLAWTPGTGTTSSYNVYRATGACPAGALTKIAGPVSATSLSDTTAVVGTTYAYVVRAACDAGGTTESGNSNCASAARLVPPAVPAISTLAAAATGSPNRTASVASHAGSTYTWNVTNGSLGAGQGTAQVTFTAGAPGTLVLSVVETGSNGCASAAATANVSVLDAWSGVGFYAAPPCRIFDTRDPAGALGGPALAAGQTRTFHVAAVCGIPAGVRALAVNVTVVNATAPGNLTLNRSDVAPPLASAINFLPGITRANNEVLQISADGTTGFDVTNNSAGSVDVIVDVNGWFE